MKRNLRKAFAFILALTMVVSLFACGKKDANPDGGDSSSDDTFTIAYIGPLTGEASAWGTPEANTLKLLVDQVNAEGGIAGKKVILNTYPLRTACAEFAAVLLRVRPQIVDVREKFLWLHGSAGWCSAGCRSS